MTFKDEKLERHCTQVIRAIAWGWIALLLAWALAACDHKELEGLWRDGTTLERSIYVRLSYDREWHADYSEYNQLYHLRQLDWLEDWPQDISFTDEGLRPAIPEGVTVFITLPDSSRYFNNLPSGGGKIALGEGANELLFRNNDTEYIVFDGTESIGSMTATTRAVTRATYMGNPYTMSIGVTERTVSSPDVLYVAHLTDITAPKSQSADTLNVEMRPVVYTYALNVGITGGQQYVRLVRGALTGMAASTRLIDGVTSSEVATVMFDADITSTGAEAEVRTFGIPDFSPSEAALISAYSSADASEGGVYGLTLELMLSNGNLVTRDFDVTSQVTAQPLGGVIEVGGIVITDAEGQSGGGFKLDITDWGEYQDIYLN